MSREPQGLKPNGVPAKNVRAEARTYHAGAVAGEAEAETYHAVLVAGETEARIYHAVAVEGETVRRAGGVGAFYG